MSPRRKIAVIYTRFSPRPKRGDKVCESCETQEERCRAYCQQMGYEVREELIFHDREASGGSMDEASRPNLHKAMNACRRHKATLVCYSLSRLTRSIKDSLEIVDSINRSGCGLALLDISVDSNTPIGRAVISLISVINQLEREQIAERTSDAMLAHQERGRAMSKEPPFGFAVVEDLPTPTSDSIFGSPQKPVKRLVINQDEFRVVKMICEAYTRSQSLSGVARKLNSDGVQCRGAKWHPQTIKRILKRANILS